MPSSRCVRASSRAERPARRLARRGGAAVGVTRNGQYLKRLAIKAGGRVTILGVKDIDWIEAEGDYVKIHAGRAWHLLRETMSISKRNSTRRGSCASTGPPS